MWYRTAEMDMGWVTMGWVGLGWVKKNGPTSISAVPHIGRTAHTATHVGVTGSLRRRRRRRKGGTCAGYMSLCHPAKNNSTNEKRRKIIFMMYNGRLQQTGIAARRQAKTRVVAVLRSSRNLLLFNS